MSAPLVQVKDLQLEFATDNGIVRAVDGVSFDLKAGSAVGLVGESGCGKSVTAMSLLRLLPLPTSRIAGGRVLYRGVDLLKLPPHELHKIRGHKIAMIFQEPMSALNPVMRVGAQIGEVLAIHRPDLTPVQVRERAVELFELVGIPAPRMRIDDFPHQLSGGMRQRVMIALALSCDPEVLIADEPTTALDVTIQAQILALIQKLQKSSGSALLFITHDLAVVSELCDEVMVMYAGRIVEHATRDTIFRQPMHPYTRGLLAAIPKSSTVPKSRLGTIEGSVPSLHHMPKGCRFANRCPYVEERCRQEDPKLRLVRQSMVACLRAEELP